MIIYIPIILLSALSFPAEIVDSFHVNSFVYNHKGKIVGASNAIEDDSLNPGLVVPPIDDGTELIRSQIENMKKEAIIRLENLSNKIDNKKSIISEEVHLSPIEVTQELSSLESFQKVEDRRHPLEETSWKISLNVGRERGTWMPKKWGKSGDRLLINLSVKFTYDDLKDREEFLGDLEGCKILEVLENEVTIGPTINDGIKEIKAKHGGWRIIKGEGPAGTDLMRFYIEIEERAQHLGSDVYCPKGRVYCTCGYFPNNSGRSTGRKELIREEQQFLCSKYEFLVHEEENDHSIFSLKKISRSKQMQDLIVENKKLNEHLKVARMQEPEKDLLRFSNDGKTALTREGGVCLKVIKGLSTQYHILGRFSIASLENSKISKNKNPKELRP